MEVELNVLLLIDMEEPPPSKEDIVGVVCGGVSVDEQEDGRTGGYDGVGVACGVVGVVERVCVEPRSVGNTGSGWISNGTFVYQGGLCWSVRGEDIPR